MEKSKRTVIQAIVCAGLIAVIWTGYFLIKNYHIERMIDVVEDDFSWVYQVDSLEVQEGDVLLKGFAFQLDMDAIEDNYTIVLRDLETGESFFLKMKYLERKDVNEYFLCEHDYVKSGFEARIKEKKINLQENDYEVLLRMHGNKRTYQTKVYIAEGQLVYANPKEFVPLDVEGTDLEIIVNEGVLRVYRSDVGMYVYQYQNELYWIAEPKYKFSEGDTYMEYQLDTTQPTRLSEERLRNRWYWDNRCFIYETYELLDIDTGVYRVAKRAIPKEYSVEKIWTGIFLDDWIWIEHFRPYYKFE